MFGGNKLSFKASSLSLGLVFAMFLGVLGLMAMFGIADKAVISISKVFLGYEASVAGIMVGAVWGFIVGTIIGAFYAFFYNRII